MVDGLKNIFGSEFLDIPDTAAEKRKQEEHKQLQSVMRFAQTQKLVNKTKQKKYYVNTQQDRPQ